MYRGHEARCQGDIFFKGRMCDSILGAFASLDETSDSSADNLVVFQLTSAHVRFLSISKRLRQERISPLSIIDDNSVAL
jgi:hypothetical protein